jgi:hypothetical protein
MAYRRSGACGPVLVLRRDEHCRSPNHTIADFLDAAVSWAEDSSFGAQQGLIDAAPWKRFAVFLYCGKIYE